MRSSTRRSSTRPADLDPPRRADPRAAAPAEAAHGTFVGRDRERAELLAGLDDAFHGRGACSWSPASPGIGKSRLADELIAHAAAHGARVLVGRCWEAGGAPAYWPWVQALRAYVRDAEDDVLRTQLGTGAAVLAQIVPELRDRLPDIGEPPALEPDAARFRLFDATAELLRRSSAARPIALVLDDLHAADAASLLLLRFVAREIRSARILVLAAYRVSIRFQAHSSSRRSPRSPASRSPPGSSLGGLSEGELGEYVRLTDAEAPRRRSSRRFTRTPRATRCSSGSSCACSPSRAPARTAGSRSRRASET